MKLHLAREIRGATAQRRAADRTDCFTSLVSFQLHLSSGRCEYSFDEIHAVLEISPEKQLGSGFKVPPRKTMNDHQRHRL